MSVSDDPMSVRGSISCESLEVFQAVQDDDDNDDEEDDAFLEVTDGGSVQFLALRRAIAVALDNELTLAFSGVVIALNVLVLWAMTDNPQIVWGSELNIAFLCFYSAEFLTKLFAYRASCIQVQMKSTASEIGRVSAAPICPTDQVNWNRFDLVIIVSGWLDWWIREIVTGSSVHGVISLLRVLRILQVARILRILEVAKPLLKLIRGLVGSFWRINWVLIFLLIVNTLFAIFAARNFGRRAQDFGEADRDEIEQHWGTCWRSFRTLFTFLTLDGWASMTRQVAWPRPDNPNSTVACFFSMFMLITYVILAAFVILSLLTGTMAEQMELATMDYNEEEALKLWNSFHEQVDTFYDHYFAFCRESSCGSIVGLSPADFRALLQSSHLQKDLARFQLDLPADQARTFFASMDADGDGVLTWEEFRASLFAILAGGSSQKHSEKQQAIMNFTIQQTADFKAVPRLGREVMSAAVDHNTNKVRRQVRLAEKQLTRFRDELDFAVDFLQRHVTFAQQRDLCFGAS